MEGQTEIKMNGKSQMLLEGELLLIPPYVVHSIEFGAMNKVWMGSFMEDMILPFAEKNENVRFSAFTCDAQIEKMLQKYLFVEDGPEHFMLISCLYMVCNECEKNAKRLEDKRDTAFMKSVIEYVSENVSGEVTLKNIADMLGYEYHYTSMLFNDSFGMNFKSFINMFRYDTACRLLMDKNKDIATIGEMCGFGSIRNFNRVFKKMSGLTPREYRSSK
jgi:YesN/AraC family two-component response regulator